MRNLAVHRSRCENVQSEPFRPARKYGLVASVNYVYHGPTVREAKGAAAFSMGSQDFEEAPVPVAASRTVRAELVFPNDTNPQGTIFGGRVLELMDVVGAIAARRHARRLVVTAEIDSVDFLRPIKIGEGIQVVAEVSWVGRTSMETEVRVYVEDLTSGAQEEAATAYLTYVAVGEDGRPVPVPPLKLSTPAEEVRFAQAVVRRAERLARRQRLRAQ